ncbi:Golgi-associated RAB2 interactor protein 1B-like isoform X2 [Ambystoma mexicanum]
MVSIHNSPTFVTLGVTSSMPMLPLPNVLLIARINHLDEDPPPAADTGSVSVELSRLLPLRHVRLSIHDKGQRLLKLRTATHRNYYLQLSEEHSDTVFELWTRLVHILHCGLSITCKDPCIMVPFSFVDKAVDLGSSSEDSDIEVWSAHEGSPEKSKRKRGKVSFSVHKGHSMIYYRRRSIDFGEDGHEDARPSQLSPVISSEDIAEAKTITHGHLERLIPGKHLKGYCYCKECDVCIAADPCRDIARPTEETEVAEGPSDYRPDHHYGLWEREMPTGLMPLSRLSSLVAYGEKSSKVKPEGV